MIGTGFAPRRYMAYRTICAALVTLGAIGVSSGCGADEVIAKDCSVQCDEAHNTCVKSCTDTACTTKCTTDLDGCKAKCGKVTVRDGG
jgi:hypothetical protein